MIEIDGAEKSGSGTVVRFAVALCSLARQPMHMFRIREKREIPGLRPQHLQAIRACAQITSGHLEGDAVGSREITYHPGGSIKGGAFEWDIGTAGSATMLAFTLIPLALFSKRSSVFTLRGGLFQDFAPSAFHMQKVLLPLLSQMDANIRLEVLRPGYVPRGGGELRMSVETMGKPLKALHKTEQGAVLEIRAISLASHLHREKVAQRMAERCRERLISKGYNPEINIIEDADAVQKGAALLLWVKTDTGCLMGYDMAGKRGRRAETIADSVRDAFFEEIKTGATVDRFTSDQVTMFAALASGRSRYVAPRLTDHIESNLWLVEKILGARTQMNGNSISIDGIGFFRK